MQDTRERTGAKRNFLAETAQQWAALPAESRHIYIEKAAREKEAFGVAEPAKPRRGPRRTGTAAVRALLRGQPRLLGSLNDDALALLTETMEEFSADLVQRLHTQALRAGRPRLGSDELVALARNNIEFSFLRDLPRVEEPHAPSPLAPPARSAESAGAPAAPGSLRSFFGAEQRP